MEQNSQDQLNESHLDLFIEQVLENINTPYRFCLLIAGDKTRAFNCIKKVCKKIAGDNSQLQLFKDGRVLVTKLCWEQLNTETAGSGSSQPDIKNWSKLSTKEKGAVGLADLIGFDSDTSVEILGWSDEQFLKTLSDARKKILN